MVKAEGEFGIERGQDQQRDQESRGKLRNTKSLFSY
jgi:hypothetical protein